MDSLSIPQGGLCLHQKLEDPSFVTKTLPQALQVNLARETRNQILKNLRNGEQVRLRFGKKPLLQVGKKSHTIAVSTDKFITELYMEGSHKDGGLYFAGNSSHTIEVQMAKEATAKSDAALATLENTLKSIQEQKASNETSFVRNKEEMRELNKKTTTGHKQSAPISTRKDRFLGAFPQTSSSSPLTGTSFSPRSGPTSAPLPSPLPLKDDTIRLEAMKIPLIHLLAAQPTTAEVVVDKLHASKEDCEKLLHKLAQESRDSPDKKELKDKSYRDLDVWKFPYSKSEDRQAAIDRAIHAFDRLRIEPRDPLWQFLLPKSERGKGKTLSKLNFNKPVTNHASPRPPNQHRPEEPDVLKNHGAGDGTIRGRVDVKRAKSTSRSNSYEPHHMEQSKIDRNGMKASSNKTGRTPPEPSKSNGKFKSSEVIQDSDEEAEAARVVLVKSSPNAVSATELKSRSPRPPRSPVPTKSFHKSKLSTSSFPELREAVPKPLPRPRNVSSPLKPAISESSPPTGSTDLDSNSTKASSQSSAPSSPPSSNEMPKQKNLSPVVTGANSTTSARPRSRTDTSSGSNGTNVDRRDFARGRSEARPPTTRGRSPVKRKADRTHEDSMPAKRQQLSGNVQKPSLNRNQLASVDSSVRKTKSPRPPVDRKASESESISSPEKTEQATVEMVDKTRRFKMYYEKYKALHEKVTNSSNAEDQEVADLWKMHNRLAEMKRDIWEEFNTLGKPDKIVLP